MFSVIFPGQGSQIIGMAKEFYNNFNYVKEFFFLADEILEKNLSKIILEGPKADLDLTENTQPAIFLASYSIYNVIMNETKFKIKNAKFHAGHSLGEYSALCCADSINFDQTIKLLKYRGQAMQNAVPVGEGGMLAILGVEIRIACPRGYEPNPDIIEKANKLTNNSNLLKITNDPLNAAQHSNVLYTDVWSSMGEENEKENKDKNFYGFTLNENIVSAADSNAIVLHCLPAYRDKEITDGVIESKNSRIFEQAENRMHVQQALLYHLLA